MTQPPAVVSKLVRRFRDQAHVYTSAEYDEADLRQEFVNPLFGALGWDMDNSAGFIPPYKEVVHEYRGGRTGTPDYCFSVGGRPKFFVETKRPSVNLETDPEPARQLRWYGWNARLAVSILTDFEEFAVYDCRIPIAHTDKADVARIEYIRYDEYDRQWTFLQETISRAAVSRGDFDRFAEKKHQKKASKEVDDSFLEDMERWRELLATNIQHLNRLSAHDLNYAVQATIDRVIFLRICEDRRIEPTEQLKRLAVDSDIYPRLVRLFCAADTKYNSGLFHFSEHDRAHAGAADKLTPSLKISDSVLRQILARLYDDKSYTVYNFAVLPPEILGSVYERFLGNTIVVNGAQVAVEPKPEVKKARGVYYTPIYIVDYIVQRALGGLCHGKSPSALAKLRVLDPACGSGSFLLGALRFLFAEHVRAYVAQYEETGRVPCSPLPQGRGRRKTDPVAIYKGPSDDWQLTTAEKERILTNNIYGVDIDPQAVEVTKLALLLKVLEGESDDTIAAQLSIWKERALPDLSKNIRCGNSLISPDFRDEQQRALFELDEDEQWKLNAFDWGSKAHGFGEVLAAGGFDAVIGNPPYGFHQIHAQATKPYIRTHYTVSRGSFEHYFLFYERSLRLLKKGGRHGFIVPVTWLTIPSADALREFILSGYALREICWLPELVFKNAKVNTLITLIERSLPSDVHVDIHESLGFIEPPAESRTYQQQDFVKGGNVIRIFEAADDTGVLRKIQSRSITLGSLAEPCSGYNPYEVGKGKAPGGGAHTKETVKEKPYHSTKCRGAAWKPEIVGRDLARYLVNITGERWIKYGPWLAAARDPANFVGRRLLIQEITGGREKRIVAAFHDGELYHSRDVIPVRLTKPWPHGYFLLAILNSTLGSWYHHRVSPKAKKQLFPKVLVSDVRDFPIPAIDRSTKRDVEAHDRVVALVTQILSTRLEMASARAPGRREQLEQKAEALDRSIDNAVFGLFALSPDEIKMVEAGLARDAAKPSK